MRQLAAVVCYLAILLAAWWMTSSTSQVLVFGLGTALLVDKFFFRLLPWSEPAGYAAGLRIRGGYFAGGAVLALLIGGWVPLREVVYLGAGLSLAGFLLECVLTPVVARAENLRKLGQYPVAARLLAPGFMGMLLLLGLALVPLLVWFHPIHKMPRVTPQTAAGLEFEDVVLTTCDGLELPAWLIPHPDNRGTVIYCHGHRENRGQVLWVLQELHQVGLNVLAFDFRAHGGSPGHTATFGLNEVRDVVAAEEYLARRFPDQPIFLMGLSYGGAVAVQALPHLKHVQAAWIESTFSRLINVADNYFSWMPPSLRSPWVQSYCWLVWLDCRFWGPDVNPVDCLEGVQVPILFCHGQQDELIPFSESQALYDAYQGPKENWWPENVSHVVKGCDPVEYNRRLQAFFAERLADAGQTPTR